MKVKIEFDLDLSDLNDYERMDAVADVIARASAIAQSAAEIEPRLSHATLYDDGGKPIGVVLTETPDSCAAREGYGSGRQSAITKEEATQ